MTVRSPRAPAGSPGDRGRLPPHVRVHPGALIDDDVYLGDGPARSEHAKGLEIGRGARIRGGSTVHDGVRIGDRLETGRNVLIHMGTSIGDDCRIWNNAIIDGACTIGNRVRIDANCYVAEFTTIGDDVTIGPGVCLANDPHPGSETHLCKRGPTIESGAQIGMNATVLPFVTIGERSMVGAGSVVTRNIPAGVVVAGNPAQIVGSVAEVTCPLDLEEGDYLRPSKRSAAGSAFEPGVEPSNGSDPERGSPQSNHGLRATTMT